MMLVRRYKKLGWWDFLDHIESEFKEKPDKSVYIDVLDELRMRLLDSVSEGGTFKLKAPTEKIKNEFVVRMNSDSKFANSDDLKEVEEIANLILD